MAVLVWCCANCTGGVHALRQDYPASSAPRANAIAATKRGMRPLFSVRPLSPGERSQTNNL